MLSDFIKQLLGIDFSTTSYDGDLQLLAKQGSVQLNAGAIQYGPSTEDLQTKYEQQAVVNKSLDVAVSVASEFASWDSQRQIVLRLLGSPREERVMEGLFRLQFQVAHNNIWNLEGIPNELRKKLQKQINFRGERETIETAEARAEAMAKVIDLIGAQERAEAQAKAEAPERAELLAKAERIMDDPGFVEYWTDHWKTLDENFRREEPKVRFDQQRLADLTIGALRSEVKKLEQWDGEYFGDPTPTTSKPKAHRGKPAEARDRDRALMATHKTTGTRGGPSKQAHGKPSKGKKVAA